MAEQAWLKNFLDEAASEFIAEILSEKPPKGWDPIDDWELGWLQAGRESGLLAFDKQYVSVPTDDPLKKRGPYSVFTFNREYLVQFAAFAYLQRQLGYPHRMCRLECHNWDVGVVDDQERLIVGVEAKSASSTLRHLINELGSASRLDMEDTSKKQDCVVKARYIRDSRPQYVWFVAPGFRETYSVSHGDQGFELREPKECPPAYE